MNSKEKEQLKVLKVHRNSVKGQLHSLEEFLKNYNKETHATELKLRVQSIETLFENFNYIHNKIDSLDNSEASINQRYSILDQYYKIISESQQKLAALENNTSHFNSDLTHEPLAIDDDRRSTSISTNTRKRKLKLPEVKLPEFNGNANKWLSFKNAFTELIHNETELSSVEKFHHLRSALSGDALNKIEIFSISEENYRTAWTTLIEAYENKRNLISHHLSSLLHLPNQEKHGYTSLASLSNGALQHVKSLDTLGVKLPDEIIVQIIEEKLAPRTYHKWEDSLANFTDNEFPSLKQLIKFLDKQINRTHRREQHSLKESKWDNEARAPPYKIRKKYSANTLVSTDKKCTLCTDEMHPLYRCNKFRRMSVSGRFAHVQKIKVCVKCLKKHGKGECDFGACPICKKPHNSLLHSSTSTEKDTTKLIPNMNEAPSSAKRG